jgi:hypothetical protein
MAAAENKNIGTPDEVRKFTNGQMEIVNVGGGTVGRGTFQPGWKWSNDVKPIAGTDLCQQSHFGYVVSGTLHTVMADGTEFDSGPGHVMVIPPGHDAWVVGNEPCVLVDWTGATNYAKR